MSDDIGKGFYYRPPGYGHVNVRVDAFTIFEHGPLGHYILWLDPGRQAEWLAREQALDGANRAGQTEEGGGAGPATESVDQTIRSEDEAQESP